MGIIRSNAEFYLGARARGVDFTRTLTLGRQRWYLRPYERRRLIARHPDVHDTLGGLRYGEPADAFFTRMPGVDDLQSLDHSAYEGATLTHDLNLPLPRDLDGQFDAVIDSGTLEHVFNVPIALANCMRLVKRGGSVFISSPANNLCGHGFYQFSPELFFRLFAETNGFKLTRLFLVTHPFPGAELSARQTWYEVTDPATSGARTPLMTSTPAFLMLEARRVGDVPLVLVAPQQSDYVARWQAPHSPNPATASREVLRRLARRLPLWARGFLTGWYQRGVLYTLRNRRAFRRL